MSNNTVTRILDAAESLFAERGFTETSLRTITTAAGVNLAAVNYHFGSKKDLIQSVFARFLDPFELEIRRRMSEVQNPSVQDMLVLAQHSAMQVSLEHFNGRSQIMKLLGFAYNQGQGHIRKFFINRYGETFSQYVQHVRASTPHLGEEEFYWRINFMLGAMIFTVSSYDSLSEIGELEFSRKTPLDEMLTAVVPVVQSMFDAPANMKS